MGFKILRFLKTQNWKVLELDSGIPFSRRLNCPSDDRELFPMVSLVGNNGRDVLRIGVCDKCGYTGYMDSPSEDWVSNFYLDTWDDAGRREIKKRKVSLKERKRYASMLPFLADIDVNNYVCEIGCGYGGVLKQMSGFKNKIGVENSRHRAEVGKRIYGLDIKTAPFESLGAEFGKHYPFGLIFSNHVLEHVINPNMFIKTCAELQDIGGALILSVPSLEKEASLSTLLYLPHLHSFSKVSFENLLARNNYFIEKSAITPDEIFVLARKSPSKILPREAGDGIKTLRAKLVKGLGLETRFPKRRILWSERYTDWGGQSLFGPILGRSRYVLLEIESLQNSYTSAPVEIQFSGNIKMFIK